MCLYIFYFVIEYYLFLDDRFQNIQNKDKLKKHLIHLLIGSLVLMAINYRNIPYIILYFILHLVIDTFIKRLDIKVKRKDRIYLLYQILHVMIIYLIGQISIDKDLNFLGFISSELLKWILFIIIIFKPINIGFKVLFEQYAPKKSDDSNNRVEGAGAMIGNLERLLIAILMYYNQLGAIGLVFTAKSVARFDKISKDSIFAEYYLIGSLYSIIFVLVLYAVIIN